MFSACRDLSRVSIQPRPFLKLVCGSCSLLRAPSSALAGDTSLYFLARFLSHVAVCVFSTLGCTWLSPGFSVTSLLNVNGCWEAWDTDDPRWKFLISSYPFQKKPKPNTTTITKTSFLMQMLSGVCRNAFWLLAQQQQQEEKKDKGSINTLRFSFRNRLDTFFSLRNK